MGIALYKQFQLYRFMLKNISIKMLLLALLITLISCQKLYYLHNQKQLTQTTDLKDIIANPYKIPVLIINCNEKNCEKYKVPPQYPQLVFWNGPGCSYKQMENPSIKSIHSYFEKLQKNPIKPLRDFLERISLLQAFGVAFGFGTFLYIVFSKLFSEKTDLKSASQKQKIK